jgi:hypothetical protein
MHQRGGALGDFRKREAGDHHRIDEILPARVGVAAFQLIAIRKGERVNDEIEPAPFLADFIESLVDRGEIADVAGSDDRAAQPFRKWNRTTPERVALIGESQLAPCPARTRAIP